MTERQEKKIRKALLDFFRKEFKLTDAENYSKADFMFNLFSEMLKDFNKID